MLGDLGPRGFARSAARRRAIAGSRPAERRAGLRQAPPPSSPSEAAAISAPLRSGAATLSAISRHDTTAPIRATSAPSLRLDVERVEERLLDGRACSRGEAACRRRRYVRELVDLLRVAAGSAVSSCERADRR